MTQLSDLDRLDRLTDQILSNEGADLPEGERYAHVLAQLVVHLDTEREQIETLLELLETDRVQEHLRTRLTR